MFIMNIPYFNLDHIYKSGQVFTWHRLDDGKYIVPFRDKAIKVEQRRDTISFSCSEEDFYNIWYEYFDLDTPYDQLHFRYRGLGGHFKISCNRCSGLHIVRQDLFEIIIASCLETATSIERTRQMMNGIAEKCGKKHKQSMRGEVVWYEFPTPEQILKKKSQLTTQDIGYKIDIITGICQDIVDGWLDLELLKTMEYDDAVEYLTEFKGIGPKVAQSICLYGLHMMNSFPVDTHIQQMLEREFDMEYDEWVQWYLSEVDLANDMGYLRQVLFYNELYPATESNYDWTSEKKKSLYGKSRKRKKK